MASKSFIDILEERIKKDLASELRCEIRAELRQEFEDTNEPGSSKNKSASHPNDPSGRMESWLASQVTKSVFSNSSRARKSYAANQMHTRTSSQAGNFQDAISHEAASHDPVVKAASTHFKGQNQRRLSTEQALALELLKRCSKADLTDSFSATELKAAWRKAALLTHPDRFPAADQVTSVRLASEFLALANAYQILEQALEAVAA